MFEPQICCVVVTMRRVHCYPRKMLPVCDVHQTLTNSHCFARCAIEVKSSSIGTRKFHLIRFALDHLPVVGAFVSVCRAWLANLGWRTTREVPCSQTPSCYHPESSSSIKICNQPHSTQNTKCQLGLQSVSCLFWVCCMLWALTFKLEYITQTLSISHDSLIAWWAAAVMALSWRAKQISARLVVSHA